MDDHPAQCSNIFGAESAGKLGSCSMTIQNASHNPYPFYSSLGLCGFTYCKIISLLFVLIGIISARSLGIDPDSLESWFLHCIYWMCIAGRSVGFYKVFDDYGLSFVDRGNVIYSSHSSISTRAIHSWRGLSSSSSVSTGILDNAVCTVGEVDEEEVFGGAYSVGMRWRCWWWEDMMGLMWSSNTISVGCSLNNYNLTVYNFQLQ